jgi:iron complex transport system substrate-binding protein
MRNPLVSKLTAGRTVVSLPASMLGCPAWYAADGAATLAARAPQP